MKKDNSNSTTQWGAIFVVAGLIWLISIIFSWTIDFSFWWPVFILAPGIFLWMKFLSSKPGQGRVELLIPANILTFLAITFLFNNFATIVLGFEKVWVLTVAMYSTGPVAIAFWITWVVSNRRARYLVPAVVLTIVSICIASVTVPIALFDTPIFGEFTKYGAPLLLVLTGLLLLFRNIWTKAFEAEVNKKLQPEKVMENGDVEEAEIVEEETEDEVRDESNKNEVKEEGSEGGVKQAEEIKPES